MKANTIPTAVPIVLLALLCITAASGCTGKPSTPAFAYMPDRLIRDISDMQEDETVARVWVRRGFELNACRSIAIEPVLDSSQRKQPEAVRVIEQGLQGIFRDRARETGTLSVSVRTALLDAKPEPGRIRAWFADIDDFAYIELELLICDTQTGMPLLKLIHFRRDKKTLAGALDSILEDLRVFFSRSV